MFPCSLVPYDIFLCFLVPLQPLRDAQIYCDESAAIRYIHFTFKFCNNQLLWFLLHDLWSTEHKCLSKCSSREMSREVKPHITRRGYLVQITYAIAVYWEHHTVSIIQSELTSGYYSIDLEIICNAVQPILWLLFPKNGNNLFRNFWKCLPYSWLDA